VSEETKAMLQLRPNAMMRAFVPMNAPIALIVLI
jgi:hypothetical protein